MDELVNKYVGSLFRKTQGIGSASNTVAFVTDVIEDHNCRLYIKYEIYSDSPLEYSGQANTSPIDWFEIRYMRIN